MSVLLGVDFFKEYQDSTYTFSGTAFLFSLSTVLLQGQVYGRRGRRYVPVLSNDFGDVCRGARASEAFFF
jgi:hypothetical protein